MTTLELIAIILPVVGFLISLLFLGKLIFGQESDSKDFDQTAPSWSLPHSVVTVPCQVPSNYLHWQDYQSHYNPEEKYRTGYEKSYSAIKIKESAYGRNEGYS